MNTIKSWLYWYNMFLWYGYGNIDSFIKATKIKRGKIVEIKPKDD